MRFLDKLLGRKRAEEAVEGASQPDMWQEDPLLLRLRESQARRSEARARVEAAQARLRELGRRYPYTS
jgi:hypothetical protein